MLTIEGSAIEQALTTLGITHVVWLPDSGLGPWEEAMEASSQVQLVRVCREGEAWTVAAGLALGGQRPLVMIQTTGLFESGDALRNALFDLRLPLEAIIGYRSYYVPNSPDTAKRFAEPVLAAWGLEAILLEGADAVGQFVEHVQACRAAGRPAIALLPEGRM